ncbi:MAG: zinc-ribbon domain-containing protein [Planctomycetota bacterium]|nr:hypothetical protein [Planctomycetaceae bacterium]MDQ3331301.1 zinc-ribbon domain-containing protein [Planctomycetota bacterium]
MMLQIPCPECGSVLKLPDRSLLGRKGKCPKCGHRFTLAEPDDVELELADADASQPVVVPSARRIADARPSASAATKTATAEIPSFEDASPTTSGTARLHDLNRRRQRQRRNGILVGGVFAVAVAGLTWVGASYLRNRPTASVATGRQPPQIDANYLSERDRLERVAELIEAESLTHGTPITLRYVPSGASVVVHLRPAELWKSGTIGEETRFCLGDEFKTWSEERIKKYCLLPASEIEEATICLILGARGSEPQVATVVRPVAPEKTSDMILRFASQPESYGGTQVFVGPERAFLISQEFDNEKRPLLFATAPASMAEDLALSIGSAGITSDGIRQILKHTDRQRHATFVFQPADLRIHEETLFRSDLRPLVATALGRIGKDAEAVAWSAHYAKGEFESELIVRNDPATTPAQLVRTIATRMDALPEELLTAVSQLSPADVGNRKLIGRLPAMTQLFAAATVGGIDDRAVVFQTRLPDRAGPNLALAGLLTWHESLQAKTPPGKTPENSDTPPATIAGKLKRPVEVDFRRTPFEDAFAFIGEETGITFEVDGDALKLAGYTRNMPQTITIGRVSGEQAVAAIAAQYDKLALVVDEPNAKIVVTTIAAAAEKGLTPTPFTP